MSSSDEDVPLAKTRKKPHPNRLKRRKNGEGSRSRDTDEETLENVALTANDLIKKYKNISRSELEELCERLIIYDQTGVYIAPGELKRQCEVKKAKQKRTLKPREDNSKPIKERFGKGKVGIEHGRLGLKICACCNNLNPEHNYHIPSGEVRVETMSHSPSANIFPKLEPFPDLNQPGCSNMHNFENSILPDDILAFVESLNTTMDNNLSEFEASLNETNQISPPTNLPNLLNDSLQIVNETQEVSDVIDLATSTYNLRDRPSTDPVVVDLTSITPVSNRHIRHSDIDVIELLDDGDSVPNVVETINLVDSDSDTENTPVKPKKALNDSLVDGKPVIECPVCLESLKDKKVMSTTCGHIFCSRCIRNIVKKTKFCPNCRQKLKPSNIHPLYVNF